MFDSTRGWMRSGSKLRDRAGRGDRGNALLVVMAAAAILFVTAAAVIGVVVFQQAQQSRAQAITRASGLAQQGMEVYLTALRIDANYRTRVPMIAGRGEDGTWTVAANIASGTITSVGRDEQSGLYHVIRAIVTNENFSGYTIISGAPLSLGKSSGDPTDIIIKGSVRGNGTITLNQSFEGMTTVEYASGTVNNAGDIPTLRVSRLDFTKAGRTYPNMYTAASTREPWVTGALSGDMTQVSLTKPLAFYRDKFDPFRNYWGGNADGMQTKPKGSQVDLAGVGIDFGSASSSWVNRATGLFYVREIVPPTISTAAKAASNAPTREQYIDLATTDPTWNVNQGGSDSSRTEVIPRGLNPNGNNVVYVGGDYDVYVKGEYSRSVTIVSERNIYIIGSITRAASATTATLGLVAKGDIIICGGMPTGSETATYTPGVGAANSYSGLSYKRGLQTNLKTFGEVLPNDMTIQAAMLSVNGKIVMDSNDLTAPKRTGLLHIKGSLAAAQGFEGENFVNESDEVRGGFAKVLIEYDAKLEDTPPPLFPQLGAGTLKIKRWDEFTSTTDPNAGLEFPEAVDYRPHGVVPIGSEETTYTSLEPDEIAPHTVSNAKDNPYLEEAVITLTAVDQGTGIAGTWHRIIGQDSGRQPGNTIVLTELTPNTATTYTVEFGSVGLDGEEETTKSVEVRVVGPDTIEPSTTVIDELNPSFDLTDGYPQVDDPDYLVYGTFFPVFTAVDTTEGTGVYEVIVVQKNDPQHLLGYVDPDPKPVASDPNPDLTKPLRYAPEGVRPPEVGFMTRQFSYYAIDAAGNRELPARTFTIKQHAPDEEAPMTFCDVQPFYIGPASIHLTGVDNVEGQGWLDTWYSLDGGAHWTTSTINPTTVTVPAPAYGQDPVEHTLLFKSRDRATRGAVMQPNVEEVQSVSFVVAPALDQDSSIPVTTSDAKPSYIGPVVINLTATDTAGIKGIYWQLDDGPITEGTRIEVRDPWTGVDNHHIDFWAIDWANNVEFPHKRADFTVSPEQIAPVTSAHNLDLYNGPAVFQLTSEDNEGGSGLAGTYYKIDDGPFQLGAGMPGLTWVTVTGEGPHTVEFYSMDHALNAETAKTCTFTVDTIAPVTTDDNKDSYLGQAIIRLSATDGGSGVKVTQWRSAADGLVHDSNHVPLGAGSWDITYWSIDYAGNVESPLKTMHVDVTASPDVTMPDSYDEITAYYKAPAPAGLRLYSWDVQSGVAAMNYKIDGGATETIEGKANPPAFYAPLVSVDGTHTIEYWASDKAGNVESPRHSKTFMLDTVLPLTTTNARAGATYWANQQFVLDATDVGSGVKATYYSLDGGMPVRGNSIWVPSPTDGYSRPHVIRYWTVDVAGNTEVVKSKSFTSKPSDTIPPTTYVVGSTVGTECISLVLKATDNPGGSAVQHIYYRIDTGAIIQGVLDNTSPLNTPKQTMFKVTGAGAHTVEYWAVDYAGNIETYKSYSANVDNVAPTTVSDLRPLYNTTATITVTAADNTGGTGVAATLYRIDGGSVTTGTAPITKIVVPAPSTGTVQHNIEFWSVDVANNVETPHKFGSFKIDVTPPRTTSDVVGTYSGPAAIALSATDDAGGSGVLATYYKLDGGARTTGTSFTVPAPTGGSKPHTLEYWSVDNATNIEPTKVVTFTVTAVANMTFSEMNPGEGATVAVRNPNVSVKATADQRITNAVATIDGVSVPVTWSNPAGYWTEGQTEEWYPDPDCVEYCPDDEDCWNWYSVIVGGASVWVPSDPNVATAVFPTAGLGNGPHVASFTFTNESDASKTKNWTFTVNAAADIKAPVTTSDAQAYYKTPAMITLSSVDEVGGMGLANIFYRLDGVLNTGTIPNTVISVTTAGKHTLEFWATDRATPGNVEVPKTVTFTVDWIAPTTTLGISSSYAGTATVFLAATDNPGGSGVRSTNYTIDGEAPSPLGVTVTGGTKYTSGPNTVIVFNSSGSLAVSGSIPNATVLVVGGGGGAGNGGGGGGGVLSGTVNLSGAMPVTVGAGGAAGSAANPYTSIAGNGGNSVIGSLTALGGGGGGGVNLAGTSGGSGGGGGYSWAQLSGGPGTSAQGNAGGANLGGWPTYPSGAALGYDASGGGGGAGAVGGNGNTTASGSGGAGVASSISGTAVWYGGGGGGGTDVPNKAAGTGGIGGGGAGSVTGGGAAGTPNTGGGGGGGRGNLGALFGGAGGSGLVIVSFPTSSASAAPSTVSQYHFDEGSGATVADASSNAYSGTVNVGTTGTQTTLAQAWANGATGRFATSLNFDGSSDFVDLGSKPALNNLGSGSFSVSAWVKTSVNSGVQTIAGRGNDWHLEKNGSSYMFEHRNNGNVIVSPWVSNSTAGWVNVVGVFDSVAGKASVYVNGVLGASQDQTGTTRVSQTQNQIGNNYAWHSGGTYNDFFWNGQIDEVTFSNVALSSDEVANYYSTATAAGAPPMQFNVAPPASGPPVNHVIRYWSEDNAGNVEATKSATFSVSRPRDTTPPTTTSNAVATYYRPTPIILTATDNPGGWGVATTYSRLDGAAAVPGNAPSTGLAGTHTLEFWSVDAADNTETPKKSVSYTVLADTTPPVTTHNALASYVGTASITLTATDTANGWGVSGMYYMGPAATYYMVDDGPRQSGTLITIAPPMGDPVPHHVDFYSVDAAGNIETTKTTPTFTVEGVQAPIAFTNHTPAKLLAVKNAGPTVSVTGAALRTIASVQAKIDGVAYTVQPLSWLVTGTKATASVLTANLQSGPHIAQFTFRLDDGSRATETWSFTTDVLAPTTTSTAVGSYVGTATVSLNAADNEGGSGLKGTYYRVDDVGSRSSTGIGSISTGGAYNPANEWDAADGLGDAYVDVYTSANGVNWTWRARVAGTGNPGLGTYGTLEYYDGGWDCPGYTDTYVHVVYTANWYYNDYGDWGVEAPVAVSATSGKLGSLNAGRWTFAMNDETPSQFGSITISGISYTNSANDYSVYNGTPITVLAPVSGAVAHHIDFWSDDNVGNTEVTRTATFNVAALPDTTAPTSRSNVATYYPQPAMITITATDNVGGWGVAKVLYTMDGGATQTINATQTGNVPLVAQISTGVGGTHTLRYWAQDRADVPNVESPVHTATYGVNIDNVKPHTTSDAAATYTGGATINLTATDNVGGWGVAPGGTAYRLNGGTIASGTVITVAETIPGPVSYNLEFWSVDRAGNKEDTETASFKVYSTPATVAFTGVAPVENTFIKANGPTVTVTGTSPTDVTAAVMSIDGATVPATLTRPTTTQNNYTIIGWTTSEEWVSDGTSDSCWDESCAPDCSELITVDVPIYGNNPTSVTDYKAATLTYQTSNLSVGAHTVVATYTVTGGRQAIKTWTFTVDTIAPTTYSTVATQNVGLAPITLTAVDNVGYPAGAGVNKTYYKLDNAATYTQYTAQFTVAAPASGSATHTITFYSDDKAMPTPGNAETPKTFTFNINASPDTTPPWTNTPGGWTGGYYSNPTTFTLNGGDTGWGVRYIYYILDGGPVVRTQALTVPIGSGAEGRHTLEWWVEDWAGLTSPHQFLEWIVDRTAPVTTVVTTTTVFTGPATIILNATDAPNPPALHSSGVATTYYSVNDGGAQVYNGFSLTVPAPDSGSAVAGHIDYWSIDRAGNTETRKGPFSYTIAPALATVIFTNQTPAASPPITIRNPTVAITGQATAQILSVSAWLDGNAVVPSWTWITNPTKLTSSFPTSNLVNGTHTVRFRYVVLGQGQADITWTFTVDAAENTPPVTTDNHLASYAGTATITLTAIDYPIPGASGIRQTNYILNGVQSVGNVVNIHPPVFGAAVPYTLYYWSVDNNGTTETQKGPFSFTVGPKVDTIAPTTTSNALASYTGTATITLTPTDNAGGTGVGHTYYSYDDDATVYQGTSVQVLAPVRQSQARHIHFWSDDRAIPVNTEVQNRADFTMYALEDLTAPTTYHNAGTIYGSTTSVITLAAVDNIGGWGVEKIRYVQDGAATQTVLASSATVVVGAEGSHSLKFWAVDFAGHAESPTTVFYKVDLTAPTTTSNALKTYIGSANVSLSATDNAGGSGVQFTYYQIDAGATVYTYTGSPISVPGPASGTPVPHGVNFWSVDWAGKIEAKNTATFTVSLPSDTTSPTTTSNAQAFYPGISTITLFPVDNVGGWGIDKTYYSVDDAAFAVGTAVPTGGSGAHHVDFYSTDLAGNRETTKTASYNVDTTAPTTTSTVVPTYTGTASISLSATDNAGGSGVKSTTYWIDDVVQPTGMSFTVAPPTFGSAAHHIDMSSTDNMNNVEVAKRADFTVNANVDNTPPVTTSNRVPNYSVPGTITLTSTDNVGGWGVTTINYSLDGSPTVAAYSNSTGGIMTATGQAPTGGAGSHSLQFWAVDKAGRTEAAKTVTYTVTPDVTPPVTTSNAVAYYIGSATIKLSATDSGWGVANTYYRVDGGATQTIAGGANLTAITPFIAPVAGVENHHVDFWSTDKAGNVETSNRASFVLEATPANVEFGAKTPAEGAVLTTATFPVSVKASSKDGKNITTVTVTLDGVPKTLTNSIVTTNSTSSFNAVGLNNAEHTVVFTVTVAGGAQASKSWTFKVDVNTDFIPPTTLSDAQLSYYGNAVVILTPTDNAGGTGVKATYFTVDAGAQTTGTVINIAGPVSGDPVSHTITYWSIDKANPTNVEVANVKTFTVGLVDKIAPTTTSNALAAYNAPGTIVLSASDNVGGSGVAHTYYKLDRGARIEGTIVGTGGEGPHTLEFWSVDKSGNEETSTKVAYKVDLTAPVTTSDAVADYTGQATIRLTATDEIGGSGIKYTYYRIDGGQQVSGLSAAIPPPAYASAQHVLDFWSVDGAGNVEATKTANFTVNALPDSTPPTTISDARTLYPVPGLITLTATDNDGGWGVDRTYYKLDGGPQTQGTAVRTGGVGDHTLEFWSIDKAGKVETPHKSVSYHVTAADTAPPVTTTSTVPASAPYIGTVKVSLVATDNSAAPCITYYRLDAAAETSGTEFSVPAPATGSAVHKLWYWSVDINGQTETQKYWEFTVSALPANMTFTGITPAQGSTVAVRNPVISIKATSPSRDIASVLIQVDGVTRPSTLTTGTRVATATAQAAGLSNLSHTISATFTDTLGATSVQTWTFTVAGAPDTTAPFTAHDGVAFYRTNATIRMTASDDEGGTGVAATYYRIDGGSAISGAPPTSMTTIITVSASGPRTIEYWSVDAAGNQELVPDGPNTLNSHRVLRINVDKVGPTTISNALETYTGAADITLTPTDNFQGSGVASTYYIVDSGTRQTGTSVHVPAPATGGALHTVYFWSTDNAGNTETTKSATFASYAPEDVTPPVTTSNAAATYPVPGVITLSATDVGGWGVAHTYYNLDGTGDTTGTVVGTGGAGSHTLEFWSTDLAGNNEERAHVHYTVAADDTIAPTTTSNALTTYTGTGQIQLTASDNAGGSGVAHTYYTWDDGVRVESTLIGVAGVGAHHVDFWSVDWAGNSEAAVRVDFTVVAPDLTAPTTTSDALASYTGTATVTLTATDNTGGSGVWVTKYTVNGGALQEGRTIVIAPPLTGSAVHEIRFYSLDNVGNQEAEKLVSITVLPRVDNTAPTTTSNGVASYTGTATINLTATDNVGGQGVSHTHYTINDGPIQTGPIVVVPGPGTGSVINHIDFWSEDFAGNEEAHKAFSFTSNAVATGNATLSFVWGGGAAQAPGSWTRLHVENSAGATIASYYGQKDLGQNLTWNVTVPAGQFYTMVVDSWYDGDSEENWSGRNAVRAPESGVMATGSTTPLSY